MASIEGLEEREQAFKSQLANLRQESLSNPVTPEESPFQTRLFTVSRQLPFVELPRRLQIRLQIVNQSTNLESSYPRISYHYTQQKERSYARFDDERFQIQVDNIPPGTIGKVDLCLSSTQSTDRLITQTLVYTAEGQLVSPSTTSFNIPEETAIMADHIQALPHLPEDTQLRHRQLTILEDIVAVLQPSITK